MDLTLAVLHSHIVVLQNRGLFERLVDAKYFTCLQMMAALHELSATHWRTSITFGRELDIEDVVRIR
jgi:hypothetical protein